MQKLINDPIYGFIELPQGIISELIEHRFYQRLRRISQLGMTQYVYPNATHSRFSHTLGALHLMQTAIAALRKKNVPIDDTEEQAVLIAILLHDLGHSPFSHSLEYCLAQLHHEDISVALMEELNHETGNLQGALTTALAIFKDEYPKRFLHQLVSGQIDVDRLDYLTRDSYFTGVAEGKVGYKRILEMLQVVDNNLVVEFKGIYSIESFLIARRLMYWQVYLHKAVVASAQMLANTIARARELAKNNALDTAKLSTSLIFFLQNNIDKKALRSRRQEVLTHFVALDDSDIWQALKEFTLSDDIILRQLADGLINRTLLKVRSSDQPFPPEQVADMRDKVAQHFGISAHEADYLVFVRQETNQAYNSRKQTIQILRHDGSVSPISDWQEHNIQPKAIVKYYLCAPRWAW
jgi:uncharacterized protein